MGHILRNILIFLNDSNEEMATRSFGNLFFYILVADLQTENVAYLGQVEFIIPL